MERAIDTQREAAEGPSKLQRHIDLMDALIQLLRGELSNQQFEQRCRETVGTSGYMLYTADRVVNACVRHLHAILGDAVATRLVVGVGNEWHPGASRVCAAAGRHSALAVPRKRAARGGRCAHAALPHGVPQTGGRGGRGGAAVLVCRRAA